MFTLKYTHTHTRTETNKNRQTQEQTDQRIDTDRTTHAYTHTPEYKWLM